MLEVPLPAAGAGARMNPESSSDLGGSFGELKTHAGWWLAPVYW
jgi:hypothetical protein